MANKYVVSVMRRGIEPSKPKSEPVVSKPINLNGITIASANYLFTNKDFTGAMEIYKQHMDDEEWEVAFA